MNKLFIIICSLCLLLFSLLFLGCGNNNSNKKTETEPIGKSLENNEAAKEFPYPAIPQMMSDHAEASRYYVTLFWDKYIKSPNRSAIDSLKMEDAYANYANEMIVLQNITGNLHACDKIQKRLFERADSLYLAGDKTLLLSLLKFSEKYLYNPNSPMLNEELYIPALEAILNLKSLPEIEKMQYNYQLELAQKNRTGNKAADFAFTFSTPTGEKKGSLYSLKADYTLLFFNNPDCPACAEMLQSLKQSDMITNMVQSGKLKILAIYVDKQLNLWRNNHIKYPADWIYAYDHKYILRDNSIYGIRAIPSFYLLNNEKRVLMKDAPSPKPVINYLARITPR
jgi:thiol-disulfide isomerase/thioredoxin